MKEQQRVKQGKLQGSAKKTRGRQTRRQIVSGCRNLRVRRREKSREGEYEEGEEAKASVVSRGGRRAGEKSTKLPCTPPNTMEDRRESRCTYTLDLEEMEKKDGQTRQGRLLKRKRKFVPKLFSLLFSKTELPLFYLSPFLKNTCGKT